jgi:outer membrane protein assembly factor BamB
MDLPTGTNGGAGVWSSPAIAGGLVYVGSCDDSVYALNANTGAIVWSYATGNAIFSSPAVSNGVVYVGCLNAPLFAFFHLFTSFLTFSSLFYPFLASTCNQFKP